MHPYCLAFLTLSVSFTEMTFALLLNDVTQPIGYVIGNHDFPFREEPVSGNLPILDEYDFIVVGSGPGGCVVSNRLSENPNWKILLLEAGMDDSLLHIISPNIIHYVQFTDYNWNFTTGKQPDSCLGLQNGRCPWPSGKGTGGSTILNNNIYTRGNKKDFDGWAKAGNVGWSYDELLPYFLKSEDVNIAELKSSPYHATGGPLRVEYSPFQSSLLRAFLASAKEVGLSYVDYNNPHTHQGFSPIQGTIKRGHKVNAFDAFIRPFRTRANLHVAVQSRVIKILIKPGSNEAYGVRFVKSGRTRTVRARKEVILSAGAFNSPQLLMLSGIGPKEHLEKVGIPLVRDLRVGDNLQEHTAFAGLAFTVNRTGVGLVAERIFNNVIPQYLDWVGGSSGRSWLTTMGCEGLGYVHTKYSDRSKNPPPDIEYIFLPASLAVEAGVGGDVLRKTMGIPEDSFDEVFRDIKNRDAWSIWPMLMYPESRGMVRLAEANPWHPPAIYSNFFSRRVDLDRIVEGIKMVIRLSQTDAFQALGSTLNRRPLPACRRFDFGSDEYWECCVRQWTMQMHHPCGTCKMGPEWDRNAVVSPRLKVHGVKRLRVIDASVMPTIPGAHTQAGVYMVAEKGADLIKEDWNWKISS